MASGQGDGKTARGNITVIGPVLHRVEEDRCRPVETRVGREESVWERGPSIRTVT